MIGLIIALIFEGVILYNFKRTEKMIFFEFYFSLFAFALITIFNAPSFINYFMDLNNIILLLKIYFSKKNKTTIKCKYLPLILCITLFWGIGIVNSLINNTKIYLIIWSLRCYLRFVIAFLGAYYFLNETYLLKIYKSFFPLLIVNALISIYQYSLHKYSADWIGGILGNHYGVNGYSIMLFMLASAYFIDSYINKKETLLKTIISLICIFICVLIADLKGFYVIFIFEFFILLIFNNIKLRNIIATVCILLGATIIISISSSFYNSINIFDIEYITNYLTKSSYSYSRDSINRTDGIEIIDRLLDFNIAQKYFGLGLGSGEYNSFFESNIYKMYSNTHYYWFLYSWLYLETGYVGIILYSAIFIIMFKQLSKKVKSKTNNAGTFVRTTLAVIFSCAILLIYNSALRFDCAYILFITFGASYRYLEERKDEINI